MSGRAGEYQDLIPDSEKIFHQLKSGLTQLNSIADSTNWINRYCAFEDAVKSNFSDIVEMEPVGEDWEFNLKPAIPLPVTSDRGFKSPSPKDRTDHENLFPASQASDGSNARLLICGDVKVRDGELDQYSMKLLLVHRQGSATSSANTCCSDARPDDHIVSRLLHFDMTNQSEGGAPHPVTHFQIGGNTDPNEVTNRGEAHHHYCRSRLDKPRFMFPPMDPVLLLELAVHQYPELQRLTNTHWKSTVKDSERIYWRKYYNTIASVYPDGDEDFSRVSKRFHV